MSSRSVSSRRREFVYQIQIGCECFIVLKKRIGEVILKINIVYIKAEKIKAEVYVNQDKSLFDLQTLIKHSFLLYFPRELLMNFLNVLYLGLS